MEIVEQIVKSRKNLKEILKDEYDTESLPIYELEEMDKLFELETTKDNPFKTSSNSGKGNACNFTLNHKNIKDHKLNIVYYNLQKNGKTKLMKNTIWKYIDKLYESKTFQKTDNVFLIINESFKETIKNMNNELNLELKEKYRDKIENDLGYSEKHFGNLSIFDIKTLQYNILNHNSVPKHTVIRDDKDIEKILEICNCKLEQLPVILKDDPVAKLKLGSNGDIFKIIRIGKTCGENVYYRVCR